ncbi:MAG: nickel pincer cofactor biosynthesis protein LarC [Chloroflexi bacterium]|nr:nickel pincer cofactor biosynthesis protein LarC [Chloroflexota bacterium]
MIAYFDCFSGASGDMLLGALVDAGASAEELRAALATLPLDGYALRAERVVRRGVAGTQVTVDIAPQHAHRRLADVLDLVRGGRLTDRQRERVEAVFRRLAEAEAHVHGALPDEVAFHEVGAVDAIVDVVGAVVALDLLGVSVCACSALPTGGGWVQGAHGLLPIPGPATLELLRRASAPTCPGPGAAELLTPTGAALLTTLCTFSAPELYLQRVGYGFGQRELDWPNAVRVWIGEASAPAAGDDLERDAIAVLEATVDDAPGEVVGYAVERLRAAGALDVYTHAVQMKKQRPGIVVTALVPLHAAERLARLLLAETTTLGVRVQQVARLKAPRWPLVVETPYGRLAAKAARVGGAVRVAPEYEACRAAAEAHGVPLLAVYAAVQRGRVVEGPSEARDAAP